MNLLTVSFVFMDYYMCRLDKELTIIESKNKIVPRWGPSDREFLNLQKHFTSERMQQVLQALWSASSRRQFLLQLKAKYAGLYSIHFFMTTVGPHCLPPSD